MILDVDIGGTFTGLLLPGPKTWHFEIARVAEQVTGTSWLLWLWLNYCPLSDYRLAYVDADKKENIMRLNRYFLNHSFMMVPYGMGNVSTALVEAHLIRDGLCDLLHNADKQAA